MADHKIYRIGGSIFIEVNGETDKHYQGDIDFDIANGKVFIQSYSAVNPGKYNMLLAEVQNKDGVAIGDLEAVENYLSELKPKFVSDFYTEIQKGNITGHHIVHKFGAVKGVGATLTPVTSSGNFPTPSSLVNLEVVSDDANDTYLGTGARTLKISVISEVNGSWNEQQIEVQLNGLTAVALPNGVYRVIRMRILTSGSYANQTTPSHSSIITIREVTGGAIWHQITSEGTFGLGQSEIAVYTVPKQYTGYLISKKVTVESTKSANVYLFTRPDADVVTAPYGPMNVKELERNLTGTSSVKPHSPILVLPGATDVGFMASADVGTADVSIDFEILLIKN